MIERMPRWRSAALAGLLLAGLAPAQLTEDPATWTRAQGLVVADVRIGDLMAVMQASSVALRAAAAAGAPRHEAATLAATAPKLLQAQNYNMAWRVASRLLAVAEGQAPGEWLEAATSYDLQLDRAVLTPGSRLYVRLAPLFALTKDLDGAYTVRFQVRDDRGDVVLESEQPLPASMTPHEFSLAAEKFAEGRYHLRYELREGEQERVACERVFYVDSRWRGRATALRELLREAQLRGAMNGQDAAALAGAEYALAQMNRWLEGSHEERHPFVAWLGAKRLPALASPHPDEEGWRQAERFARTLAEGRPALASETGELRLARHAGDTLVPYRLVVPKRAATDAKPPLVVLRHSFLGDEGTWSHLPGQGELEKLAAQHGALVMSLFHPVAFADPNDRFAADLDAAIDAVVEAFGADPARVYLAGHGTGAVEALFYGLGRAPRFAGVAALAGAPPRMFDTRPGEKIPALFVYSKTDEVAPETEMRKWAAFVETRLKRGKALVLDGESHAGVIRAALPRIFEFFVNPPAARE